MFVTELTRDNKKSIHEQLSKYLMTNLKPGADPAVVNDLMKVTLHVIYCQILFLTEWAGGNVFILEDDVCGSGESPQYMAPVQYFFGKCWEISNWREMVIKVTVLKLAYSLLRGITPFLYFFSSRGFSLRS